MINPKDLLPAPKTEFRIGGIFYRKEQDGSFSMCCIYPSELENETRGRELRALTQRYLEEGILYINRNAPWRAVSI